jgi:hypothetical protein
MRRFHSREGKPCLSVDRPLLGLAALRRRRTPWWPRTNAGSYSKTKCACPAEPRPSREGSCEHALVSISLSAATPVLPLPTKTRNSGKAGQATWSDLKHSERESMTRPTRYSGGTEGNPARYRGQPGLRRFRHRGQSTQVVFKMTNPRPANPLRAEWGSGCMRIRQMSPSFLRTDKQK